MRLLLKLCIAPQRFTTLRIFPSDPWAAIVEIKNVFIVGGLNCDFLSVKETSSSLLSGGGCQVYVEKHICVQRMRSLASEQVEGIRLKMLINSNAFIVETMYRPPEIYDSSNLSIRPLSSYSWNQKCLHRRGLKLRFFKRQGDIISVWAGSCKSSYLSSTTLSWTMNPREWQRGPLPW